MSLSHGSIPLHCEKLPYRKLRPKPFLSKSELFYQKGIFNAICGGIEAIHTCCSAKNGPLLHLRAAARGSAFSQLGNTFRIRASSRKEPRGRRRRVSTIFSG